jgi:nicotinate-nucleotide pyrophosphorylase (carboxylating)
VSAPAGHHDRHGFPLDAAALRDRVRAALEEDAAFDDVSTLATVPADAVAQAYLRSRAHGVVCGVPLAIEAFQQVSPMARITVHAHDGDLIAPGQVILDVVGPTRGILQAERVALNFAIRLSAVATRTRQFVDAIRGTQAQILDTRKTTPGYRLLEKYAVRCGGGRNHRMDLRSMAMLKDNHLAAVGGEIARAVAAVRAYAPDVRVEVEADRLDQVDRALAAGADIIMLDNMDDATMREAVRRIGARATVEASGGVTLERVRAIAETGVDWISIGGLTHSAPAVDLGLDM